LILDGGEAFIEVVTWFSTSGRGRVFAAEDLEVLG
jgi:hypothetical protein